MRTFSTKGFTLIELLVVIAIISIITAIVMTNFGQAKSNSRDAKRISDIAQLQLSLELYFDRCNQYPTLAGNMPDIASNTGCPSGITLGSFISSIPIPPTASDYTYATNGTYSDYVLRARLENNNQALIDDVDGTVYGLDCSDSSANEYYCVQPR